VLHRGAIFHLNLETGTQCICVSGVERLLAFGALARRQGVASKTSKASHGIADAAWDEEHQRNVIAGGLGAEAQIKQTPSRAVRRPIDWPL
jgi:hypothetical protein